MNLCEAGIGEERASFVSAIGGGDVAAARIGREIKHISVSPGGEHDGIRLRASRFFRCAGCE